MNKKEEIFTIGDKTTLGIITCFRLLDNEIMVDFDNKNSILLRSKQLQHSKQPLFTTTDGVDIYEGDNCCSIMKNNFNISNYKWKPTLKYLNTLKSKIEDNFIIFSTKEKAEEYVLCNKPVLSLNDIKTFEQKGFARNSGIFREIEKLVKERLKQ